MYRHEIHVLLRAKMLVTSPEPVSQTRLLEVLRDRVGAWRREELRFEKESGLRRLNDAVAGPLRANETARTVLRSDPDALELTIDQGPLLVSQSSEEDPAYADQVEHLRCARCGSHDVEDARWAEAATLDFTDSCSSIGDEVYCRACEEQTPSEYGSLAEWRRTHPSVPG